MAILSSKQIKLDPYFNFNDKNRIIHSITFGKRNTWDHWHLAPETRPVIEPPNVKRREVSVPGRNAALDLTDSIMGFPRYENRTGKLNFIVLHDYEPNVFELIRKIGSYLHGREMTMRLEDDWRYFYKGIFWIESVSPTKDYSKITIGYEVEPFKWSIYTTDDRDWEWDPFNFRTGIVPLNLKDVRVVSTSPTTLSIPPEVSGVMQETYPKITVTSSAKEGVDCEVNVGGIRTHTQHLNEGENRLRTNLIGNSTIKLSVKSGNAAVDIFFRRGVL